MTIYQQALRVGFSTCHGGEIPQLILGEAAGGCFELFLLRGKEERNGHRCDPLANVSVVWISITRSVAPVQIIPRTPARRYAASVHRLAYQNSLGRRPRHLHPLAAPHHPPLGRTPPGYNIARAYAGHTDTTGAATTTCECSGL